MNLNQDGKNSMTKVKKTQNKKVWSIDLMKKQVNKVTSKKAIPITMNLMKVTNLKMSQTNLNFLMKIQVKMSLKNKNLITAQTYLWGYPTTSSIKVRLCSTFSATQEKISMILVAMMNAHLNPILPTTWQLSLRNSLYQCPWASVCQLLALQTIFKNSNHSC